MSPKFNSEADGRLGNNLMLYQLMLQLSISLDVDAYINDECYNFLSKIFDTKSIKLRSIQKAYCNYDQIKFQFYSEHIQPLLRDKQYRKGKVLYLWPKLAHEGGDFNGYK